MITGAFQDGTIQIPCANVGSNVCLKSREKPFTRITPRNASSYQFGKYDGGLENLQLYDVTSSDNQSLSSGWLLIIIDGKSSLG
jgi:hypothetical protein